MKRPCLALYLVAEGTKDEHVAQMLLSKLPAVDAIAKDEVLKSFGDDLRGDEEEIANALLAKLTESEDEDDDHEN
jgi:AAA+ superfamily predicted ATPase